MSPDLQVLRRRVENSFPARCVRSFARIGGLDRVMVISSQAFTTLIPLLIIASAFVPLDDPDAVSEALVRRLGLSGDAAAAVRAVFGHPDPGSVGLLSLVILAYSGVSFTRRIQRMYLHAWQMPTSGGLKGSTDAALGLAAIVVEATMLAVARQLVERLPLSWFWTAAFPAAASVLLWTSIPWLLMGRHTEWRRFLPGGVLTGVAVTAYNVATTIYMPRLIETYSDRYGLFGVTIAVVSWLLCISSIVVAATVVAAELDRAPDSWARGLRARLRVAPLPDRVLTDPRELDA